LPPSFDPKAHAVQKITAQIATELNIHVDQAQAAVNLLDGGATVPFIARYRKEATQGLDDIQLRALDSRLSYLRELEQRRSTILDSIREQGKLTPALQQALDTVGSKQELEDLYLPYKPKRRTKGMIAREAGIEPLADTLFNDPLLMPSDEAQRFIDNYPGGPQTLAEAGFADAVAVLEGVRDVLSERWAEDAVLVQSTREWLWQEGWLQARLVSGKNDKDPDIAKFRDYFDYQEPISQVPSHRALAVFRGRTLEVLEVKLVLDEETVASQPSLAETHVARHLGWHHQQRPGDDLIKKCVAWTWKVKLSLSLERDLFARLREQSEKVSIKVFAENLRDLLLAAPAGKRVVMGLDPGIRTGVKVAVVSETGRLLETATVYPHEPKRDWDGALHTLSRLVETQGVDLIAIGNGTASRETDKLAADLIKKIESGKRDKPLNKVVVSEAGASVYSASEFASKEFPDLDVSLRGAVSIARRLQDPLAELVKIDPKSIGVGQYQHDVNQSDLAQTLQTVVEDCVNAVGVDLNTASAPLLTRVSGLNASVASNIVGWRDVHGAFKDRRQLREVSGLGAKTFEQAAGFLRVRGGDNPLDMSGVHPETYPLVEKILAQTGRPIQDLIGKTDILRTLMPEKFADEKWGLPTIKDILTELEKPGRDPRPDFKVARFNESVQAITDLKVDMVLEGTVSNVAQFGAFVDLGVHQDGLIHVSQLAKKFVADAREIVKTGDIVRVKVLEVDVARRRISLTMKLDAPAVSSVGVIDKAQKAQKVQRDHGSDLARGTRESRVRQNELPQSAMAAAFAKLKHE
jgi:uncharacterized protein